MSKLYKLNKRDIIYLPKERKDIVKKNFYPFSVNSTRIKYIAIPGDTNYRRIGVAIENIAGGLEFIESNMKATSLIKKGLIFFKHEGYETCCVFYNVMDYISFMNIRKMKLIGFPLKTDVIILTDECFYPWLEVLLDDYEEVLGYFPNSVIGKMLNASLGDRVKKHFKALNPLYKGYPSLCEYYKNILFLK